MDGCSLLIKGAQIWTLLAVKSFLKHGGCTIIYHLLSPSQLSCVSNFAVHERCATLRAVYICIPTRSSITSFGAQSGKLSSFFFSPTCSTLFTSSIPIHKLFLVQTGDHLVWFDPGRCYYFNTSLSLSLSLYQTSALLLFALRYFSWNESSPCLPAWTREGKGKQILLHIICQNFGESLLTF